MRGFGLARLDMLVLAGSARPVTPRRSPMRPTPQLLIEERRTAQTHTHTPLHPLLYLEAAAGSGKNIILYLAMSIYTVYCILYCILYTIQSRHKVYISLLFALFASCIVHS